MPVHSYILTAIATSVLAVIQELSNVNIGINVQPITEYDPMPVFVDCLNQARPWGTFSAPYDYSYPSADLNSQGWPTTAFGVTFMADMLRTSDILGVYTVVWQGSAVVTEFGSSGRLSNTRVDSSTGYNLADYTISTSTFAETDSCSLRFSAGTTLLKIIRPGYSWNSASLPVFTQTFIDSVKSFAWLRVMDWMGPNNLDNSGLRLNFSDRSIPSNFHCQRSHKKGAGLPLEWIAELANKTGKDLWLTFPVETSEAYWTDAAQWLKDNLPQSCKIYIEWGNEVWNYSFSERDYIASTIVPSEISAGNTQLQAKRDELGSNNAAVAYLTAEKIFRMSDAFRSVFGASTDTRVRPVYAWQATDSYTGIRAFDYASNKYNGNIATKKIYAYACATYWGLGDAQSSANLTLDQMAAIAYNGNSGSVGNVGSIKALWQTYAYETVAGFCLHPGRRLKLLTYEGGPDTSGTGSGPVAAQYHKSSYMRTHMDEMLADVSLFFDGYTHYYSGAGKWVGAGYNWSLSDSVASLSTAPKTLALQSAMKASPQVKFGKRLTMPATVPWSNQLQTTTGARGVYYGSPTVLSTSQFLVNFPETGTYDLYLKGALNTPATFKIDLAGDVTNIASLVTSSVPFKGYEASQGGTDANIVEGKVATVQVLSAGIHLFSVRLNSVADGVMQDFRFVKVV